MIDRTLVDTSDWSASVSGFGHLNSGGYPGS